jgi:hypothetical protein
MFLGNYRRTAGKRWELLAQAPTALSPLPRARRSRAQIKATPRRLTPVACGKL